MHVRLLGLHCLQSKLGFSSIYYVPTNSLRPKVSLTAEKLCISALSD